MRAGQHCGDFGDNVTEQVRIGERDIAVDECIAPLVRALNDAGIPTVASCCGHGKDHGTIVLADGRDLRIFDFNENHYTNG